jgi:hypothetical protein
MKPASTSASGEIDIELEGVAYRLRPSFTAIREIEQALDRSILEVAKAAEMGTLTLDEAGIIVAACIKAQAQATGNHTLATIKPARAAEEIYAGPGGLLTAVRVSLYPLLLGAILGKYTPAGEPRPRTTKTN